MNKTVLVLMIVLVTLFLFFISLTAAPKEELVEKTFPVDVSKPVFLEFRDVDGSLRFAGSDKNLIQVRVKKDIEINDPKKAAELLEATKVEISQLGNTVRVEIRYPRRGIRFWFHEDQWVRVSTEILLPSNANLDCRLADGSIHGESVSGDLKLKTVDGPIEVTNATGSLLAHSTDGRIELQNIKGRVEASSTDGDISISGQVSRLAVDTSDGDVSVEVGPQATMETNWRIETSDGDVDLIVPKDFSADFTFQTDDGQIDCQVPLTGLDTTSKRRLSGKLNQGGKLFTIRTGDGKILVR